MIRFIVRDTATRGIDFLVWGDGDPEAARITLGQSLAEGLEVELIQMPADNMDAWTRRLIEGK